jgi:hypothetical protein
MSQCKDQINHKLYCGVQYYFYKRFWYQSLPPTQHQQAMIKNGIVRYLQKYSLDVIVMHSLKQVIPPGAIHAR